MKLKSNLPINGGEGQGQNMIVLPRTKDDFFSEHVVRLSRFPIELSDCTINFDQLTRSMIRRFPVGTAKFVTRRMLSTTVAATPEAPLLSEQSKGGLLQITLNRPKALNALTLDMCQNMNKLLTEKINVIDTKVGAFLVKGAGEKAFCAGGDVKSIWQELITLRSNTNTPVEIGTGKPGHLHTDFFRDEYIMNYMLAESLVPQVSIWDGFVMGGGVGISIFGEFRVATEKAVFAMPETGKNVCLSP